MATATQVKNFIAMIAPIAKAQAQTHGNKIFASVCIAQACHESGYGTSAKMMNANALFGIKVGASAYKFGTAWKGAAYKTGTTEYYDGKTATRIVDWFRAYDSLSDATEDYYDMLCTAKRYKAALNCETPKECITAIVRGGYATGPSYATAIMSIIKTYKLTQYDHNVVPTDNPYTLTDRYMKKGSKSESVKWLQFELNKNGAGLAVDGHFGALTDASVRAFQKAHGLKVDGIVGKKTLNAMGA